MAVRTRSLELTMRGQVVVWLAALASGAAWIGGDTNARLAAALLAAPLLVDFLVKARRLDRTEVRVAPRRAVAGVAFTESAVLVHRGRLPLRDLLFTEPRTTRSEPPVLVPALVPDAGVPVTFRAHSLQRGHVQQRLFVLATSWPLGLLQSRGVVRVAANLVTEPARVPLRVDVAHAVADRERAPRDRVPFPGPEFHSLREHAQGEDARFVHAVRSASLGTLVRRVTQGRTPSSVGIVLDLRRPPARHAHHGTRRFEWCLGACASLVALLRPHGPRLHVVVLGEEPTALLVQGPAQETELLTLLAEAEATAHRGVPPARLAELRALHHCFWIPAAGNTGAAELAAFSSATVIGGGEVE